MPKKIKTGDPILVPGRAGELVDYTDPETFGLVEDIFAYNGPFRTVLKDFGIGGTQYKESFLVFKEGRVFSDIVRENKALWESCMMRLIYVEGHTALIFNLNPLGMIKGLAGFVKKNWNEARIISNPLKYLALADERYEVFSDFCLRIVQHGEMSREEFLEHYVHVVYVTYLYELFFNFNLNTLDTEDLGVKPCMKAYIASHDYLFKFDTDYAEVKFAPLDGFSLRRSEEHKLLIDTSMEDLEFIPSEIPDCECDLPERYLVEKKLQCLKNNLRLKSAFLLNFMKL